MKYKLLGNSDIKVSEICLGTMNWGTQNSEAEGHQQMDYSLDHGVNFFDTAEMYPANPTSAATQGRTEEIIGSWFKSSARRDQVVLATKVTGEGLKWVQDGVPISPEKIRISIEGSLKRLQTDYIDLYQLHWPNRGSYHFGQIWGFSPDFDAQAEEDNFLEVLRTLNELIQDGKIRHVGLSNETAWGLSKWMQLADENNLPRMASIQNEYSLLCRHFEPDLAEIAIHEDCGLLAWSPLCRGMLSGKYLNGARPAGARITIETRFEHRVLPQTDAAIQKYVDLAEKYQLDVCQMGLAFVRDQAFVSSVLIGATNMEQLKSNIDSVSLKLSAEVYEEIGSIRREFPMLF
ncbi:MAG: aldo/keto reductase [Gammaproteobacteria bacterium]|nr:aldo/keto reductase [Gammaproteobacteria bacterium]